MKVQFTDEEARIEISKVVSGFEIAKMKSLPKEQRDQVVAKVKEIEGLTQRQISRITGISLSLINRA